MSSHKVYSLSYSNASHWKIAKMVPPCGITSQKNEKCATNAVFMNIYFFIPYFIREEREDGNEMERSTLRMLY